MLSPTRELAIQIAEQFEALGSGIQVKCAVLVGGIDMMAQVSPRDEWTSRCSVHVRAWTQWICNMRSTAVTVYDISEQTPTCAITAGDRVGQTSAHHRGHARARGGPLVQHKGDPRGTNGAIEPVVQKLD